MGKLDGKITIVTGATSGIAAGPSRSSFRRVRRSWPPGAARSSALARAGAGEDNCLFVKADATKEADVKTVIDACLSKWGRLDCLFNNAGGPAPVGGIETIPVEGFDAAMATLVRSVMLGMKHAAPIMMRQGSGSIINNGSVAARRAGYSTSMIYGAQGRCRASHGVHGHAAWREERAVQFDLTRRHCTGIFAKALGLSPTRPTPLPNR